MKYSTSNINKIYSGIKEMTHLKITNPPLFKDKIYSEINLDIKNDSKINKVNDDEELIYGNF
jgi:hypothetical protein